MRQDDANLLQNPQREDHHAQRLENRLGCEREGQHPGQGRYRDVGGRPKAAVRREAAAGRGYALQLRDPAAVDAAFSRGRDVETADDAR